MQIPTIPKTFEAFECKSYSFEKDVNHLNSNSNHSKGFLSIRTEILTIGKELKHSNPNFNPWNEIQSIRMQILSIRKEFKEFDCKFNPFERESNHSNANVNHLKYTNTN